MDLDSKGEVIYVTRENADDAIYPWAVGYQVPCREISPIYAGLTEDPNSMHYATVNDPVYWIASNALDAGSLFIKPDPTSAQPANVYHISYPTVEYNATLIANFPDEAENLVVLKAAITAAEYQMAIEEDMEVYGVIVSNLKQEYQQGVLILQTGSIVPPQQKGAR